MGFFRNLGAVLTVSVGTMLMYPASAQAAELPNGLYARIGTPKGDIVISLAFKDAPLTVCNFVGLAEGTLDANKGKRYFDGLSFHRVVADFVIQGGDPKGDGTGGPGYAFPNEISPNLLHDNAGVVAMANAGPDTNGSQFYITLAATPFLNGNYSVFGKVVEGMDVVKKIVVGDKMTKVQIIRMGADAKAFKTDQAAWNKLDKDLLQANSKKAEGQKLAAVAAISKLMPGVKPDSNGLYTKILKGGSGALLQKGQTAMVNYKLTLLDGTVVDSSEKNGGPLAMEIGKMGLIQGFEQSLLAMKKGEKRLVIVPPELGYGQNGVPGSPIKGDTFLVFTIELADIK